MADKEKMPLALKGAWLNLVLVTAWLIWFLLEGVISWLFIPLFAVTITILLFTDWVYERSKNTGGDGGVR